MRGVRGLWSGWLALCAGALVWGGCGPEGGPDVRAPEAPPGESVQDGVGEGDLFKPVDGPAQDVGAKAQAVNDARVHVAALSLFWAADRFRVDGDRPVRVDQDLDRALLAKAQPEECFTGIGQPSAGRPPCSVGRPKVNDAYVWGLVLENAALWFGTVANTHCLVQQSYLGLTSPQQNDYWVCEFGASASGTGDWRPPNLYRYDLATRSLVSLNPPPGSPADLLRRTTVGFRSAGAAGGVVFLAGPALVGGGINVLAYDAHTGALLGATKLPQYDDIRSWVTIDGVLYAGVGNEGVVGNAPAGSVLRWTGTKSVVPGELFRFEVVGLLDTAAANLAEHQGRLFVTTWPFLPQPASAPTAAPLPGVRPMSLWRSPAIPPGGLTAADAGAWAKLWSITDYDPDPIAAATTGGGALASFKDTLYFGTMHVPFVATAMALRLHAARVIDLDTNRNGTLDAEELLATALGTHRSISLFQVKGAHELRAGKAGGVKVLYGEKFLPRYEPSARSYTIAYDAFHLSRAAEPRPAFGASGLGNFFNAYTWSMQVFDRDLYVGTFDWSQLVRVGLGSSFAPTPMATAGASTPEAQAARARGLFADHLGARLPREGADLFRFEDARSPAEAESLTGLGNDTNYGFRTMQADAEHLYVGTANPMNLHPRGGWELLELTPD